MNRRMPPGGHQTFTLGGNDPIDTSMKTSPNRFKHTKFANQALNETQTDAIRPKQSPRIAIVVSAGAGSYVVVDAVKHNLTNAGFLNISTTEVCDPMMLPCIAQVLIPSNDIVIALSLITNDIIGTGSLVQTLIGALLQVGIHDSAAIIPGIFAPSNLLEAKVLLPELASKWVNMTKEYLIAKCGFDISLLSSSLPTTPTLFALDRSNESSSTLLIDNFRMSLKNKESKGIFHLIHLFHTISTSSNKMISLSDFIRITYEYGLKWTNEQCQSIFTTFTQSDDGFTSIENCINVLRGPINESRKQIILLAFESLDSHNDGYVEFEYLKLKFNSSKHPEVIFGRKTSEEINEFLHTFDGLDNGTTAHTLGIVTIWDFCDYYCNISTSIQSDEYFELMIRNTWHMLNGLGWKEHIHNQRVIVTRVNGFQYVAEVKNETGIHIDDNDAVLARLHSQ
eukprot:gene12818-27028_t